MKRLICMIMSMLFVLSFFGCTGKTAQIDINDTIIIPEDGIIKEDILSSIKQEDAIGCFRGHSGDYTYEWTIFGSDITDTKDINLKIEISKESEDLVLSFAGNESFGFTAMLSVYLNEVWDSLSAAAYKDEKEVCSVSLTGTKNTVLNLAVKEATGSYVIRRDEMTADISDEGNDEEDSAVVAVKNDSNATAQNYLSPTQASDTKVYSDGKDKYHTNPTPPGKPKPVEPENQDIDKGTAYTCTFSIECATILNNLSDLDPDKREMVPSNGTILKKTKVTFYEGESVFDVLQRICKEKGIHLEFAWTPIYNSAYIEGIHNLYEFDCGALSGWMYRVNGWYPNYGCSRYQLKDGDVVEWRFTCDLGNDIGGKNVF